MFRMMCKDLRISPLRTFLTGLSMFIGIVAMIAGVLVGTLGREFLLGVNAQILGRTPTYTISIAEANFADSKNTEKFLERLRQTGDKAMHVLPEKELQFTPIKSIEQLKEIKNTSSIEQRKRNKKLYESRDCKGPNCKGQGRKDSDRLRVACITSRWRDVYNVPIFKGRWFDESARTSPLEVVLNKSAYDTHNSEYFVSSRDDTLDLISFNVVGVVNDGLSIPMLYVNVEPLVAYLPNLFTIKSAQVYWYDSEGLSTNQMKSYMNDILHDTVGGKVVDVERTTRVDSYGVVVDVLQLSLFVSAMLLLLATVFGQINIGLASLEQRMRELLIRRALGASKCNIVMLVLSSLFFLSMIVCAVSVLVSMGLVHLVGLLLSHDSPIASPTFPITAAFIAVAASVFTALLGGLIPAIKAFRLEPALALR